MYVVWNVFVVESFFKNFSFRIYNVDCFLNFALPLQRENSFSFGYGAKLSIGGNRGNNFLGSADNQFIRPLISFLDYVTFEHVWSSLEAQLHNALLFISENKRKRLSFFTIP